MCFMTSIVNCAKGTEFPRQRRQQRSALVWVHQPHGKTRDLSKPGTGEKVANYFNVSIDWLMDNEIEKQPTEGELSGIRKDLMDFADTLTDEKIEKYLRLMKTLESEDI